MFDLTRSSKSSREALLSGFRLRYSRSRVSPLLVGESEECLQLQATFSAQILSMFLDLSLLSVDRHPVLGDHLPPLGSFSAGNVSPPQMFHSETAVTIPAKPKKRF